MAKKAVLHELIAVEGDLEGTAKKILEEGTGTFKKHEAFTAFRKDVKMLADTPEARLEEISEAREMTTTVTEKLDYISGHLSRYYDALLQKEATNQNAKADLVIDGAAIAKDLPATFLLGMENRLKSIRATYESIPTLEPGRTWLADESYATKGAFVSKDDEIRTRTKKVTKPVVLYEATDKHPANVKEVTEDVVVGRIVTRHWSGAISPAAKSELLSRIDKLIRGCKKARQRANATEVVKLRIGKTLLDYINNGTVGTVSQISDEAYIDD